MINYLKIDSINGQILTMDNDGIISFVPEDPANSDYAAYLASLEAPQA